MVQEYIKSEIAKHRLPADFIDTVERWYKAVAEDVAALHSRSARPIVLGVQGLQGSGKSTLASFLDVILRHELGLRTAVLSIDDFYLTRSERLGLAETVHPLLATRGVPGTHDVNLARATIDKLLEGKPGQNIVIPRFNKAVDDREAESRWNRISGPVNIVIFEGWCVGARAQPDEALRQPVNSLEKEEDSNGVWRTYVNDQLKQGYADLFSRLDALIVLSAPSFECVFNWRLLQERKLKEKWQSENPNEPSGIQTPEQLQRFISHYERLSRHCLATLPEKADWLLELNENHAIIKLTRKAAPFFIVATDLDGTLLDHQTYAWAPAAPAINALKARRIPIVFNTSKTREEVLCIQQAMAIDDPYIVENGSAVYLPKSLSVTCPDNAIDCGSAWLKILGVDRSIIVKHIHALRKQFGWQFEGFSDWDVEQVVEYTGLDRQQAIASLKRQFSEPILWRDSEGNFRLFMEEIEKCQLKLIRGGRFSHIIGNCDKGLALAWLATRYRNSTNKMLKLIVLGDSPNDIDMLSVADYAVTVKSPVHGYPEFNLKGKKILTSYCGPEGWNNAVLDIINNWRTGEEM